MRADRDHRHLPQPGAPRDLGRERPDHGAGRHDVGQQRPWDPQPLEELDGPLPGTDVGQGGRRVVGELRDARPGEPVGVEVGHEQQGLRAAPQRPGALGLELEHGVERQVLHAGDPVELRRRDPGVHARHRRLGAPVAVRNRLGEQRAVRVEQAVVDRPRVDADRRQRPRLARGPEAVEDRVEQRGEVPAQGAVGVGHGPVREPGDLGERHDRAVVAVGAAHLAPDHPAAGRTEVDGRERRDRCGLGRHRQRRNAAATPESTGMCRPVVCDRSPAASANAAAATCSGSTSFLRRVRCA